MSRISANSRPTTRATTVQTRKPTVRTQQNPSNRARATPTPIPTPTRMPTIHGPHNSGAAARATPTPTAIATRHPTPTRSPLPNTSASPARSQFTRNMTVNINSAQTLVNVGNAAGAPDQVRSQRADAGITAAKAANDTAGTIAEVGQFAIDTFNRVKRTIKNMPLTVSGVASAAKRTAENTMNAVRSLPARTFEGVKQATQTVRRSISRTVASIKSAPSRLAKTVKNAFASPLRTARKLASDAGSALRRSFNSVKSAVKSAPASFKALPKNILKGKALPVVGQIVSLIDVGIRGARVANSTNRPREAVAQTCGFTTSLATGTASLVTSPTAWVARQFGVGDRLTTLSRTLEAAPERAEQACRTGFDAARRRTL